MTFFDRRPDFSSYPSLPPRYDAESYRVFADHGCIGVAHGLITATASLSYHWIKARLPPFIQKLLGEEVEHRKNHLTYPAFQSRLSHELGFPENQQYVAEWGRWCCQTFWEHRGEREVNEGLIRQLFGVEVSFWSLIPVQATRS
jgi:hypothetical protein